MRVAVSDGSCVALGARAGKLSILRRYLANKILAQAPATAYTHSSDVFPIFEPRRKGSPGCPPLAGHRRERAPAKAGRLNGRSK